jgi:hypothetical protein
MTDWNGVNGVIALTRLDPGIDRAKKQENVN